MRDTRVPQEERRHVTLAEGSELARKRRTLNVLRTALDELQAT